MAKQTNKAHELIRGIERCTDSKGKVHTQEHCNSYIDTHVFHSVEDVHSLLDAHRIIATNIPLELHHFVDELADFNISHHHQAKENKVRFGRVFAFMLPRKFNKKEATKLSSRISEYFDSCPYFSYIAEQGKAHLLCVYCADRHYYLEPQPLNTCTAHDRYFNKKTGRLCSKDDPDAVLKFRKGDVLHTEMANFSFKIDSLVMFDGKDKEKSVARFRQIMRELKHWYYDVLRDDFGFEIIEGAAFRKIKESKIKDNKEKTCAQTWNNIFLYMENQTNNLITGTKQCGLYQDFKQEIYDFIFHFKKSLQEDGYFVQNRKEKISFGIYKYNESGEIIGLNFRRNLEFCQRKVLKYFRKKLKQLAKMIFGASPELCM